MSEDEQISDLLRPCRKLRARIVELEAEVTLLKAAIAEWETNSESISEEVNLIADLFWRHVKKTEDGT